MWAKSFRNLVSIVSFPPFPQTSTRDYFTFAFTTREKTNNFRRSLEMEMKETIMIFRWNESDYCALIKENDLVSCGAAAMAMRHPSEIIIAILSSLSHHSYGNSSTPGEIRTRLREESPF